MELEKIQNLMNQFEDSDLRELKIDDGTFHFYLSKNNTARPTVQPEFSKVKQDTEVKQPIVHKKNSLPAKSVKAPIVGIVYLQAKPGQPAFVKVGDRVNKGDTVCVIEAMKMMTEVKSDLTGVVTAIKVENEDLVEVGQPLIEVKED